MARERPDYLPISEHGLIGDLRTAALVGADGRIDWYCPVRFDSPSVFGAILDAEEGGHFTIRPVHDADSRQFYLPDSNVLITRFLSEDGVVEVRDFLAVERAHDREHRQRLVRHAVAVRGSMRMRVDVAPRFDYGRAQHEARVFDGGVDLVAGDLTLRLVSDVALSVDDGDVRAEFDLDLGHTGTFSLETLGCSLRRENRWRASDDGADAADDAGDEQSADEDDARAAQPDPDARAELASLPALLDATVAYWRAWLSQSTYAGRWRETVNRSALTLKLLTHEPSGAVIAAPTTSLPEELGGGRNWDYRHVWIRDAAFSLYALIRLGFTEEAGAFMGWLTDRFTGEEVGENGPLAPMYDIDGATTTGEVLLDHWEGYRGSSPVRIANDAGGQLQLDIYGELIDSIYLFNKYGSGISYEGWSGLTHLLDWLADHWSDPDEGIWEVRSGRRHHTFSRLMCWVAFERMIRVARARGLPGDVGAWAGIRDAIFRDVVEHGYSRERHAFVQEYDDGQVLDASVLLMPMVKFLAPTDPLFTSTLAAIEQDLVTDALVFRYDPQDSADGLEGAEGTFTMCSFWYVEALTRTGRLEEARFALEKMFTYASPLGLFAEELGMTGEHLGNFPQAFTHLSLISAAYNLDRALG